MFNHHEFYRLKLSSLILYKKDNSHYELLACWTRIYHAASINWAASTSHIEYMSKFIKSADQVDKNIFVLLGGENFAHTHSSQVSLAVLEGGWRGLRPLFQKTPRLCMRASWIQESRKKETWKEHSNRLKEINFNWRTPVDIQIPNLYFVLHDLYIFQPITNKKNMGGACLSVTILYILFLILV